ncbi:pyridoxamine 5'-phosphate oxidase family protein [Desulfosoma caldarium]|uniref:Pyridoxamine 5'-phosphate oxidase n=1 Tax=Desulfosoma caldarium TaxID=610254 RepID=A0A3N1UN44_9BACT|nr:pyridoxamine 5'-phosphate oxidase family protein [Desulfosoma caldarium]ROQ90150.1 pyridoxamine 5'-phosphate oxidase [Desulfosoma caldarium]
MLKKMIDLLTSHDMCVLATCRDHKPHCSLMAYVTDEQGLIVYMATRQDTTKFQNIRENGQVSLLVDTRQDDADRASVRALTVEGWAAPLTDAVRELEVRRRFQERHPQIHSLLNHPQSTFIEVRVRSFLLLEGPEKATHMMVK